MDKPVLSVITVVFNNVRDVGRTLDSVINQTYPFIEYIVIDGQSTDGTLEILKQYNTGIKQLLSEKDKGIYDAMNKGLALATGDYVIFMNSGDEFYASNTVEKVFAVADDADIYYGETEMINDQLQSLGRRRHRVPEKFTWKSFKYGMSISHQAIYVKRSIAGTYNPNYQLSADIDWIICAAKKADKIVNTHLYVAKYLVGGMSKTRHRKSLTERFHIMRKHYGLTQTIGNHFVIAIRLGWYFILHSRTND